METIDDTKSYLSLVFSCFATAYRQTACARRTVDTSSYTRRQDVVVDTAFRASTATLSELTTSRRWWGLGALLSLRWRKRFTLHRYYVLHTSLATPQTVGSRNHSVTYLFVSSRTGRCTRWRTIIFSIGICVNALLLTRTWTYYLTSANRLLCNNCHVTQ